MADQKLIDEVGKYIDKYYEPAKDDIKMDKEMKSILIESQASGKRELRKSIAGSADFGEQSDRRIGTGRI